MTEERKLVTVLFADIVGSTEISLKHDPEVVRATLARTFEAVREVLVAHGGTVEKFIGDAVMAVFGVPAAHEDDADRAVRAAFALRERTHALGGRVSLDVRVGVNTGEAVTGADSRDQLLVTGTAVTAAARLQQAATPGEILVGALTHNLTHVGVRYGPRRSAPARGLGSLDAWPAIGVGSIVPETQRGVGFAHAPMVGRLRELRVLEDAFARVEAEGAPALVTMFGAAGVGKSRLATEFITNLGRGTVLSGRCLPYGQTITFHSLQQMVRTAVGIEAQDDHSAIMAKIARATASLFDDLREAEATAARVAVAVGLAPAEEALPDLAEAALRHEVQYGLRRFFERSATRGPLVLIFEDLQWADRALVELIEYVAEASHGPMLLLCIARPDFRDSHAHFAAEAANATTITLAPLTTENTERLISALLVIDALPDVLRSEIAQRAEGNPLFAEEFLRLLMETGRIEQQAGRWVAVGDVGRLELPPTLVGLVSARLDGVSSEVKQALQWASVAGRVVSVAALEAIGGLALSDALLREAVRRDLLAEADDVALGTGRVYRFKHLVTRDVAYRTISKKERARLHDRFGRWIESTLGDQCHEASDLIAFHAEQSWLLLEDLGDAAAGAHAARALDWLLHAGTRARHRGDEPAALAIYERAVRICAASPSAIEKQAEAVGFLTRLRWQRASARTPALEAELEEALAIAEQAGPSEVLVQLLFAVAFVAASRGRSDEARSLLERLVTAAEACRDVELTARAMLDSGALHYFLGDLNGRIAMTEAALEYMRAHGAKRAFVHGLLGVALNRSRVGAFGAAGEHLREAEAMKAAWSKVDEEDAAFCRMVFAHDLGDLPETRHWAAEAKRLGAEIGRPQTAGLASLHLGELLLRADLFDEARDELIPTVQFFEKSEQRQFIPEVRARLGLAYAGLGDLEAARENISRARDALLQPDPESLSITGAAEAVLAEADSRISDAEAAFRTTIAAIDCYGMPWRNLVATRVRFAAFLVRQRRFDDARLLLANARAYYLDPLAFRRLQEIDGLLDQCATRA